jgi:ribosome-associated translation inhibitor RaiA
MRMKITAHGCVLTDELRESVEKEIERLAQSVDRPINIVSVQLYDERGRALRGLDCRCDVHVEFDDSLQLEDSDAEADFRDSICEAFTKIMRDEQRAH